MMARRFTKRLPEFKKEILFSYDDSGNLELLTVFDGAVIHEFKFEYDADGNLRKITEEVVR